MQNMPSHAFTSLAVVIPILLVLLGAVILYLVLMVRAVPPRKHGFPRLRRRWNGFPSSVFASSLGSVWRRPEADRQLVQTE